MAPKTSRANKKTAQVNSEDPATFQRVLEILNEEKANRENQEGAVENDKKTSKPVSGRPRIAKAEDWDPKKLWHAELLKQLQRHFGQGPMKKYVDSMHTNKRNIFYDYEIAMLSEVLAEYKRRPLTYPLAIAIVFMKQRKDNMAGFDDNVIKLDFTNKQIRDKLDHMWKKKKAQGQQPKSTTCLQRERGAEMSEENSKTK
ncbi:unnamed protein product [Caenorhabditis brenneri]